jgi:hypothetical protein
LRLAAKDVDDVHGRMRLLAAQSVRLGKGLLYLTVHVRRSTNQHSLRWRGFVVVGGCGVRRHLSWDEAAVCIAKQPYAVRMELARCDAEARELNEAEQQARQELRRLLSAGADGRTGVAAGSS